MAKLVDLPTPLTPQKTIEYGRFWCFASCASRRMFRRRCGESSWTSASRSDERTVALTPENVPITRPSSCVAKDWHNFSEISAATFFPKCKPRSTFQYSNPEIKLCQPSFDNRTKPTDQMIFHFVQGGLDVFHGQLLVAHQRLERREESEATTASPRLRTSAEKLFLFITTSVHEIHSSNCHKGNRTNELLSIPSAFCRVLVRRFFARDIHIFLQVRDLSLHRSLNRRIVTLSLQTILISCKCATNQKFHIRVWLFGLLDDSILICPIDRLLFAPVEQFRLFSRHRVIPFARLLSRFRFRSRRRPSRQQTCQYAAQTEASKSGVSVTLLVFAPSLLLCPAAAS